MEQYEEIKNVYEKKLFSTDPVVEDDHPLIPYLQKFLPEDKNSVILDAACGNGKHCIYLHKLGYNNLNGIDLFETSDDPRFKYDQSSLESMPFDKEIFDMIYCGSAIYYCDNPEDAFKELSRVLKKGERLLITAHTKYSLFTYWRKFKRWIAEIFKLDRMSHLKNVHFDYSIWEYLKMAKNNGLVVDFIDGYYVSFLIVPLYRKLLNLICKLTRIKPPKPRVLITKNKRLGFIKSIIAYHSVLVFYKA